MDLAWELYERGKGYEYEVFVSFEITNDDFIVKIEYIIKRDNHEPETRSIENILFIIDNDKLKKSTFYL